jgi:2-succinyl-5-enolpyruvyl-6-hydroxy-3-cyclohexene-1-carboxylate synthase
MTSSASVDADHPSAALATVLVDELVRLGVREAVLAPGSRSAPLAFALQAADAEGRLRLHVRIDERGAGFLALGLAKASGRPVPVVTTSGTATANLHPATLEASESGVPVLLLTADRPPSLRATGASQTVDQVGIFGSSVRLFHEVGVPTATAGQGAYWRALAGRAVAAALGTLTRDPGPVHLNLAFAEPLVPGSGGSPWPEPLDGRPDDAPWTAVHAPGEGVEPAGTWPVRTLVVVGDAPEHLGESAARLAQARGWPVLAEPSSGARRGPHALRVGHLLLGEDAWLERNRPDRVLVVGRPTLHRSVGALLRRPDIDVAVVAHHARWADATRSAATVLPSVPEQLEHRPAIDPAWLRGWLHADTAAATAMDAVLATSPDGETQVAATLLAALPAGSLLVAGSSMPVRDLALAVPRDGVTVLSNRGAAGIDGTVSTAVGAALAWQADGGGRAWALLGDLTFLHDAGGLLLGPDEPRPELTIVVVNNDGGSIFGLLEQGAPEHAGAYERVFGTSHGADLAALCGASGTPHTRVSTAAELANAVLDPRGGLQVVEIRTDRKGARERAAAVRSAASAALRALTP